MKNIFSIIIILASVVTFAFFVKPKYAELSKMKDDVRRYENVLRNARKLQEIRDSLLEKQKQFSRTELSRLEKMIPDSANNVKLILELQNIASKYGISIQTASSKKDEKKKKTGKKKTGKKVNFDVETKDYGIMTLSFGAIGPYQEFLSFLEDLEDNIRIIDLREITIEPSDRNPNSYNFGLTLDTYWLKDNI